ncbi:MAG TPA: CoA transferase [Thermoanaerobaculia bacterium]|nr:CoA transferase [Thermoanaerobaculia bacterium]
MTSTLPLTGITVADFSRVLAGPLCTMMLADAGARVIKVERPGSGDDTRQWGPPFIDKESAYFLSVNRNKESLTIDLKSAPGQEVARRLIARSDVVIDNFLPIQRERFGLTAPQVHRYRSNAICCSIAGYPSDGPNAESPGYDLLAQASGGLMAITGETSREGVKTGVAISDILTAHYAHGAILAALHARQRTGEGSAIEVSLLGATLASLINVAQNHLISGSEAQRWGNSHASIVPYGAFHASDGQFVVAVGTDAQFEQLCRAVLRREDLAVDERFRENRARVIRRDELVSILNTIFAEATVAQWVDRCVRADIPASPVEPVSRAMSSHTAKSMVDSAPHPTLGTIRVMGSPVVLNGRRLPTRSAPPVLGEHTKAILAELGFTNEEADAIENVHA